MNQIATSRIVLGLLGVTTLCACTPSINPTLKKSVDSQLATLQVSKTIIEASDAPVGYQSGQWLQYRILDEKDKPTIATYKILESEGNHHTIESSIESYYSKMNSYMELEYEIGAPLGTMKILRVISNSDTQPAPEIADGFQMSILGSMYKSMAQQLFITEVPTSTTDKVSVSAGTFMAPYERDTTLRWGPLSYKAHSWHHGAVPMHGMVKSERKGGTKGSSELIAYGLSGAQSELLGVLY